MESRPGSVKGLHVYSDPASERHVNALAAVESPRGFPRPSPGSKRRSEAAYP